MKRTDELRHTEKETHICALNIHKTMNMFKN